MRTLSLAAGLLLVATAACATEDAPLAPQPDYAQASSWLCRPGAEAVCAAEMDALGFDAQGQRTPEPRFKLADDAPVDCFYVYPTISQEHGTFADAKSEPSIVRVARAQAGRFASVCGLYVPLYRQFTLEALFKPRDEKNPPNFNPPYDDVKAAWRHYLEHDNHGHGVILIGHSQGTILLQRLLAEEIDGKPEQKRLVLALLGGNPGFSTPPGKAVGGTLKSIPVCHSRGEAGCVLTWSSYLADDTSAPIFGRAQPGMEAACTNPAAIGGGRAPLKGFVHKPAIAPESDPPFVEQLGQMSAECVADKGGATLRIRIEPGPFAGFIKDGLAKTSTLPGWGLHALDYNILEGDLIDDVAASSATWMREQH
ncbi:MAG TPA: DUF3089 domain-containing protein [Caulobacteraceae bacterium]|nr:DUF3089 domain-containing protein [Caulobacteraceae bacterium]